MKNSQELRKVFELMKQFNVTSYEEGQFKVTMAPQPPKIELPKLKDISLPAKTKEQEAEELLFHSATR